MKKLLFPLLIASAVVFQYCSSTKNAQQSMPRLTYANHIQSIISTSCAPCHIPPQGRMKALNTYESAKANIDDIIARIQKNPDEKGFMPFKHPKLPDSTIQKFVQWKADGMPQ